MSLKDHEENAKHNPRKKLKTVSDKQLFSTGCIFSVARLSLVTVKSVCGQFIDCRAHLKGVNSTNNYNEEEVKDYEGIDRKTSTVFVVLLLVELETLSTDEVDVSTLRTATAELKPGFGDFHLQENARED